jgi:threonyl-tRNA synthetase
MSITDNQRPYVAEVVSQLRAAGFRAEADLRNEKIGLKIREAEKAKVPFMFVVGEREVQSGTLAIRGRSGTNLGSRTVAGALDLLRADLKPTEQQHTLTQ